MLGTYTTCGGIEHSRAGGPMPQQQVVQIQCGVPPAELPGRALGKAWHAPKCSPHLAFGGVRLLELLDVDATFGKVQKIDMLKYLLSLCHSCRSFRCEQ